MAGSWSLKEAGLPHSLEAKAELASGKVLGERLDKVGGPEQALPWTGSLIHLCSVLPAGSSCCLH